MRRLILPLKFPSEAVADESGVPNAMNPHTPTAAWSLDMLAVAPTGRRLARGHSVRWNPPALRWRFPPSKIPGVAVDAARSWNNSQRGPALRLVMLLYM